MPAFLPLQSSLKRHSAVRNYYRLYTASASRKLWVGKSGWRRGHFFGPGNESPSATNVVLVVVVVVVVVLVFVVIKIFHSLRLCRFSIDRNETFHTY